MLLELSGQGCYCPNRRPDCVRFPRQVAYYLEERIQQQIHTGQDLQRTHQLRQLCRLYWRIGGKPTW